MKVLLNFGQTGSNITGRLNKVEHHIKGAMCDMWHQANCIRWSKVTVTPQNMFLGITPELKMLSGMILFTNVEQDDVLVPFWKDMDVNHNLTGWRRQTIIRR